jgi:hypothetical protein
VETPEAPREGNAARLGKSAEAHGLVAARWVGRGDEQRGLTLLALAFAAGAFVTLFFPWLGFGGHGDLGWSLPLAADYGLLALGVVLVALLVLMGAWTSRGSELLGFCLVAAAGLIGVSTFVNLRWGSYVPGGFEEFMYGSWLGLVFAVLLVLLAALLLPGLWRSAR